MNDKSLVGEEPTLYPIQVKYQNIEGYHVFTSPDVRGLYVASREAKKAYNAVAEVLAALLEGETGQSWTVKPTRPFADFLRARAEVAPTKIAKPVEVLQDSVFFVSRAA